MARIGVDVGGTFTDLILETDGDANGGGRVFVHKVPSTPEDQSRGVIQGVLEICAEAGRRAGRHRADRARHDHRDEYGDRVFRRRSRNAHHAGLPRHPAHGAAQAAAQLLGAVRRAVAVAPAGQAPQPRPHYRAHPAAGRQRRDRTRRGRGARRRRAVQGARGGCHHRLLPLRLPERRARAARQGDRQGGDAGCLRQLLLRGG